MDEDGDWGGGGGGGGGGGNTAFLTLKSILSMTVDSVLSTLNGPALFSIAHCHHQVFDLLQHAKAILNTSN